MSEPTTLQAGDTIRWTVDLPQYPASDWVLSYRLINADSSIDISGAQDPADPSRHLISITAAASAAYKPGAYTAVATVSRGADRHTVGRKEMRVLPDLAAAPEPVDARSESRRALDDLRAALRRWLSTQGTVVEYEIAGRRIRFATADDIRKRIQLAEAEVVREEEADRMAAGLGRRRRVLVRF